MSYTSYASTQSPQNKSGILRGGTHYTAVSVLASFVSIYVSAKSTHASEINPEVRGTVRTDLESPAAATEIEDLNGGTRGIGCLGGDCNMSWLA